MRIKNILLTATMIFLLAGCSSLKNKWSPVGNWEYLVTDTPEGDSSGTLVISASDDGYIATIKSLAYGESELSNFSVTAEKKLSGNFFLAGYEFYLTGTFQEDSFAGQVESSIAEPFPMTAHRSIQ